MAEQELRTATTETQAKSPQSDPKPKAARAGNAPKTVRPKLNERGVPITNWDDPELDPNLRAHVGDSPDGAENKDNKAAKAALKARK